METFPKGEVVESENPEDKEEEEKELVTDRFGNVGVIGAEEEEEDEPKENPDEIVDEDVKDGVELAADEEAPNRDELVLVLDNDAPNNDEPEPGAEIGAVPNKGELDEEAGVAAAAAEKEEDVEPNNGEAEEAAPNSEEL